MRNTKPVFLVMGALLAAGCAAGDGEAEVQVEASDDALFEGRKLSGHYRAKFGTLDMHHDVCAKESHLKNAQVSGYRYELKPDGTYVKALYRCDAAGAHCVDMSLSETRAGMTAGAARAGVGATGTWKAEKRKVPCPPYLQACPAPDLVITLRHSQGTEQLLGERTWLDADEDDLSLESSQTYPLGPWAGTPMLVLRSARRGKQPVTNFDACAARASFIER